jgi:hypothetical protein
VPDVGDADYTDAFPVLFEGAADRAAIEWLRATWEGAPGPVRTFLLVGWRLVLGFRMGPSAAHGHVLGWPVIAETAEEVAVEQRSGLLRSRIVLSIDADGLMWRTFVTYEQPRRAAVVWAVVGVFHRIVVPWSLRRAVRHTG